jgi:AsmA protein
MDGNVSVLIRIRRWAVGLLALFLFVAAVLVVLPHFVSEQEVRAAAVRSLKAATGVEPLIAGEARLTFIPQPAIRLGDVRLDHRSRPGINAGSLQATVRLLPLLFGRVEIDSFTLEEPRLRLELGADGAYLAGLPLRPPAGAPEETERPKLRIVGGSVALGVADADQFETLSTVEASLAWSGQSLAVTGSFHWRGVPTTIDFVITDTNSLGRGDRSGIRFRLDSEFLRVGFDGGLAFRNGIQANGSLSADSKSLRSALAWFSVAAPTRGGFGRFKLKAQAALTPAALALSGLAIELDGNRAEGGLTFKRENGRAILQSTLASEAADFTPYSGGFAVTGEDGRDWSREPIDIGALDDFDVDLRLSAARVVMRKTELATAAIATALKGGRFTFSIGEAQFYGGRLRGTAALGRGAAGPEIKIDANISDFDLQRGLGSLAGIQHLEGKGTLDLALEGSGPTVHAIARNLSGQATLTAGRGSLNGINVEEVLRRLDRAPLSAVADFRGGRTGYDRLLAKLRITRGKARLEEAQVDSPVVRVTLAGETSIADRELDLKGMASLLRPSAAGATWQPFDLPFIVQGTWDRPALLPDAASLIQRSGAAAPLLDALRKRSARETPTRPRTGPESTANPLIQSDRPDSAAAGPSAVHANP